MQSPLPGLQRAASSVRLFFCLWPEDAVRLRLAQWRDALHAKTGGRRMPTEDLHLTLAFLGDVPVEIVPRVVEAGARVRARDVTLCVDVPAYWKHNRIVWAGPERVPDELAALARELRHALVSAGIRFDAKSFVPHITLIREAADFRIADLPPIEWNAGGFVLVRSDTGQKPRYRIVEQWRAKAASKS